MVDQVFYIAVEGTTHWSEHRPGSCRIYISHDTFCRRTGSDPTEPLQNLPQLVLSLHSWGSPEDGPAGAIRRMPTTFYPFRRPGQPYGEPSA